MRGCYGGIHDRDVSEGSCLRDSRVRAVDKGAIGAAVLPVKAAERAAAGRLDGTGTAAGAANLALGHVAVTRVARAELHAGGGARAAYTLPDAGKVSETAVVEVVRAFDCCVKSLAKKWPEQWFKCNRCQIFSMEVARVVAQIIKGTVHTSIAQACCLSTD